jgi:long-subunit acyl-CoA synthetase (AMP-forming)
MVADVRALIEAQAAACSDAPFVIEAETGRALGFADLRARALSIARLLAAQGLTAGDRAGLFMPNGVEAVALFVGVMAAGCVAPPLSLLATSEQLAYLIANSGCKLVFAGPQRADQQAALSHQARVEIVSAPLARASGDWPTPPRGGGDDALLMYTSGTTGRPKGVRLTQANVLAGALRLRGARPQARRPGAGGAAFVSYQRSDRHSAGAAPERRIARHA